MALRTPMAASTRGLDQPRLQLMSYRPAAAHRHLTAALATHQPQPRGLGPAREPGPFLRPPVQAALPAGAPTFDMTHWGLWWKFNKESLLDLRTRLSRGKVISGTGAWGRPSARLINDRVLPVLFDSMEDASYDGLISGSIVALGRIGTPQHERMASAFDSAFGRKSGEVRETAALGLGLLGQHNSMERLTSLLSEPESYRKDFGYTANDRMRAYAAYGIGFLASRSPIQDVKHLAVLRLLERITDKRDSSDVRVACLNALGIIDLAWKDSSVPLTPSSHREGLIAFLLDIYEDGTDTDLMAHLPVAIARLLHGAPPLHLESATRPTSGQLESAPRPQRSGCPGAVLWRERGLLGQRPWPGDCQATGEGGTNGRRGVFPGGLALISLSRLASKADVDGALNPGAMEFFEMLLIELRKEGPLGGSSLDWACRRVLQRQGGEAQGHAGTGSPRHAARAHCQGRLRGHGIHCSLRPGPIRRPRLGPIPHSAAQGCLVLVPARLPGHRHWARWVCPRPSPC